MITDTRKADLVLAIGDMPMVVVPCDLEIEKNSTSRREPRLIAVIVSTLNGKKLRIEREGICEASGQWLQSTLAKSYWIAAQAYVDGLVPA